MNTLKIPDKAHEISNVLGRRIQMHIPSVLAEGENFDLRISITGADGLPLEDFKNPIKFTASIGVEGLPRQVVPDEGESAISVTDLCAAGAEVAVIKAQVDTSDALPGSAEISSNPAWVFDDPPYRIYWGDIHVHTAYSECSAWRCQNPEWAYLYARDVSMLDFAAPADHLRGIAADKRRWPHLQELARKFNQPGEFVSFLAYESSHAKGFGGDNNVYFDDDDAPHFWVNREDMKGTNPKVHLRTLWEQMDKTGPGYFTIPHHTGRSGKYRSWNEPCYDPEREPLFEIYSSWGSSEMRHSRLPIARGNNDDESYFVDALKAGARFGVIGSSDDHATLPGSVHHFRTEPYKVPTLNGYAHKGLAAVRCDRLQRSCLFEAMRSRNTYATTHARSLVDIQVDDISMGRAAVADRSLKRRRQIHVYFTLHDARSAKITLMRNGEPFEEQTLKGADVSERLNEVVFEDNEPLDSAVLKGTRFHPEAFAVYYARVEDSNGAHQWTSPVWVDME